MSKELRVISIGIRLVSQGIVVCETLETDTALFDFHVVVIRPPKLQGFAGCSVWHISTLAFSDGKKEKRAGAILRTGRRSRCFP